MSNDDATQMARPPGKKWVWSRWLLGCLAAGVVVAAGTIAYLATHRTSPIPRSVAEKALFTLYYPGRLPQGYKLDDESYHYFDDTVIFAAKNADGQQFVFTEVSKPKDFDFVAYYKTLIDAKKLDGVPHDTVTGRAPEHKDLMSITTDSTWILVTAGQAVPERDWRTIAEHLRQ
jgi:hypothetical protein